jgi:hypothetical protein
LMRQHKTRAPAAGSGFVEQVQGEGHQSILRAPAGKTAFSYQPSAIREMR